jgi:hypothetical protein
MSAGLARSLPGQEAVGDAGRVRHIEIVSTRAQRRARPRVVYALLTVAGLFAILIVQLLMSIAVSDGAYQIARLQTQQTELTRDRQVLAEHLRVLNSPQNLAANAESLGMVANTSSTFLRLADGKILGTPEAAKASAGSVVGPDGALLIADSLLNGVALLTPQPGSTTTGAPTDPTVLGSVASEPEGLPAPITR